MGWPQQTSSPSPAPKNEIFYMTDYTVGNMDMVAGDLPGASQMRIFPMRRRTSIRLLHERVQKACQNQEKNKKTICDNLRLVIKSARPDNGQKKRSGS